MCAAYPVIEACDLPAPKPPLPPRFEGQLCGEPFVKVGTRHRPKTVGGQLGKRPFNVEGERPTTVPPMLMKPANNPPLAVCSTDVLGHDSSTSALATFHGNQHPASTRRCKQRNRANEDHYLSSSISTFFVYQPTTFEPSKLITKPSSKPQSQGVHPSIFHPRPCAGLGCR